jgi:hypothetical protein
VHLAPALLVLAPLAVAGCGANERPTPPLDDVLRLHHVQSEGTHNSYHVEPTELVVDEWRYTLAPLDVQLESQGVRHFELDVHRDEPDGPLLARHLAYIDPVSNCPELSAVLRRRRALVPRAPAALADHDHHGAARELRRSDGRGRSGWSSTRWCAHVVRRAAVRARRAARRRGDDPRRDPRATAGRRSPCCAAR